MVTLIAIHYLLESKIDSPKTTTEETVNEILTGLIKTKKQTKDTVN